MLVQAKSTREVTEDDEARVSSVLTINKQNIAGHYLDISLVLLQENS